MGPVVVGEGVMLDAIRQRVWVRWAIVGAALALVALQFGFTAYERQVMAMWLARNFWVVAVPGAGALVVGFLSWSVRRALWAAAGLAAVCAVLLLAR
jgi:hypothetical protein